MSGNQAVILADFTEDKAQVNIENVTLVKENVTDRQREKAKNAKILIAKSQNVPTSINVIGQTLDDAKLIVEKYLDDVSLSGLDTVTIIHGKGTGVLKDGLRAMLKKNKRVAQIRAGSLSEGGEGATIVKK